MSDDQTGEHDFTTPKEITPLEFMATHFSAAWLAVLNHNSEDHWTDHVAAANLRGLRQAFEMRERMAKFAGK